MNTHFIAKSNSNDIWDTLFFIGVPFIRRKTKTSTGSRYEYDMDGWTVVIEGNKIKVGDQVYKSANQAKHDIVNRWIRG